MVGSTSVSNTAPGDPADAPLIPKAIASLSLRDDPDRVPPALDRKPTKKLKDASAPVPHTILASTQPPSTWPPLPPTDCKPPAARGPKARKRQQAHSPAVSGSATRDGAADSDGEHSQEVTAAVGALLLGTDDERGGCAIQPPAMLRTLPVAQQVHAAEHMLTSGRIDHASAIADALLTEAPDDADALCLKGRCLMAAGDRAAAYTSLALALHANTAHTRSHLACAELLAAGGDYEQALRSLQAAWDAAPGHASVQAALGAAMTDMGTRMQQQHKLQRAREFYERALEVQPDNETAHYNQGVVSTALGRVEEAMGHYRAALGINPRHREALCNMGVLHQEEGELALAVEFYERAWAAAPEHPLIRSNLSSALVRLGTQVKEAGERAVALRHYERALAVTPHSAEAMYNTAVALAEDGATDRSIFMYEMAVAVEPSCAEAWNNLGVLYRAQGDVDAAARCYERALHAKPNFPQACNNLAVLHTASGRARQAYSLLQAAVLADPTYSEAYNNLGVLLPELGLASEAVEAYEQCLALCPDARNAGQNRLLALNYLHSGELPAVADPHKQWGEAFAVHITPMPPPSPRARSQGDQLRVGYISPDLFTHSVSYFAEAPLRHHSKEAVELHVYSCVVKEDAKTERLRSAVAAAGGSWHDVAPLTEEALAERIRGDCIDVLVELTGHTAHNRLGTMARRPAPVQVTWIGYPNTTGLPAVDYRLTDATCDPPDTTQPFSEELVRLPECFLCYTAPHDAPPVAPLPALLTGHVTFGSFNNLGKVTGDVMALWGRVLSAVPGSRLLLKSKPFACSTSQRHYLELLAQHGVDTRCVELLPLTPSNSAHMATYAHVDIGLDPFPYAGTTTTAEALWMGVPCVTLRGRCHAQNVGASLLGAVGLGDACVAEDGEGYIAKAVALAADLQELALLREGLRDRMRTSPLCDAPRFVATLERVYEELWQRWVAGKSPWHTRTVDAAQ